MRSVDTVYSSGDRRRLDGDNGHGCPSGCIRGKERARLLAGDHLILSWGPPPGDQRAGALHSLGVCHGSPFPFRLALMLPGHRWLSSRLTIFVRTSVSRRISVQVVSRRLSLRVRASLS